MPCTALPGRRPPQPGRMAPPAFPTGWTAADQDAGIWRLPGQKQHTIQALEEVKGLRACPPCRVVFGR
jgi:hypothetical protein